MKRTKTPSYYASALSDPDESKTAKALTHAINHVEPARQRIAKAIDQCSRLDGYNELWTMLGVLVEVQDLAAEMGERDLVATLGPAIMLAYMRAAGLEPEKAKRELKRLHGILPPQNAPGSGTVQ